MTPKLYIPKIIKVGFQERRDTFTGKLGYIVYIDDKGVTRKEHSWSNWKDDSIEVMELENKPQSSFSFNKGIQRSGDHFSSGRSVIRVHDERNFEFEISVDNLIGILMHSDVSKRDIVEECVYAWHGKDLILLPVNSEQYIESVSYTKKQSKKLSTKDFVPGSTYSLKKSDEILVYIGFFPFFESEGYRTRPEDAINYRMKPKGKKHIFQDIEVNSKSEYSKHFRTPSTAQLAERVSNECVNDYADRVTQFEACANSLESTGWVLEDFTKEDADKYMADENKCQKLTLMKQIGENKFVGIHRQLKSSYGQQTFKRDIDRYENYHYNSYNSHHYVYFAIYEYDEGSLIVKRRNKNFSSEITLLKDLTREMFNNEETIYANRVLEFLIDNDFKTMYTTRVNDTQIPLMTS